MRFESVADFASKTGKAFISFYCSGCIVSLFILGYAGAVSFWLSGCRLVSLYTPGCGSGLESSIGFSESTGLDGVKGSFPGFGSHEVFELTTPNFYIFE